MDRNHQQNKDPATNTNDMVSSHNCAMSSNVTDKTKLNTKSVLDKHRGELEMIMNTELEDDVEQTECDNENIKSAEGMCPEKPPASSSPSKLSAVASHVQRITLKQYRHEEWKKVCGDRLQKCEDRIINLQIKQLGRITTLHQKYDDMIRVRENLGRQRVRRQGAGNVIVEDKSLQTEVTLEEEMDYG